MTDRQWPDSLKVDLSPYVGRWVALSGNEVAGVGETATAALRLGQRNRPRERLRPHFVEPPDTRTLALSPLYKQLESVLIEVEEPLFLVGGAVRDALLGRPTHDLDFVVPRNAIKVAYHVADGLSLPAYVLDRERDTGRVVLPGGEATLDFARFRRPDLEGDLRDRDFTVNAMALPVGAQTASSVIDPCGGREDLEKQLLRMTHDLALADDPVRALRGARLAIEMGFQMHPETVQAARAAGPRLGLVSAERIRDELLRLIQARDPGQGMALLESLGLLSLVLPEVAALTGLKQSPPHRHDAFNHTLAVLNGLSDLEKWLQETETEVTGPWIGLAPGLAPYRAPLRQHLARPMDGGVDGWLLLRLGALLHDTGKAETGEVGEDGRIRFHGHETVGAGLTGRRLRALRLSKAAIAHVMQVVAGHMRPLHLSHASSLTRRAIYRYFRDTGQAGLDIGLLALADHLGTYQGVGDEGQWQRLLEVVTRLFDHYFNHYEQVVAPSPLVDGRTLIEALEIDPGPRVGRLLRQIEEAQASGEISTPGEALALAQAIARDE